MATDVRGKISKLFIIPQRYILAIMCCGSIVISYAIRYGFSRTLIFLSVPANETQVGLTECSTTEKTEMNFMDNKINVGNRYELDKNDQLLITNSFFWLNPVCQIFGGVVSDQYGGKHTLGIPILLVTVITFFTPPIIQWSEGNRNVLITIRIIMGLIQGWIFPAIFSILSQWVPYYERSFIATLTIIGMPLGKAMANYLTTFIILSTKYWGNAFYVYGLMSLVWFITWNLICYSSPQTHPFISDKEKEYLKRKLEGHVFLARKKVPVWSMVRSVPLWATLLVQFGQSWVVFAMIDDLPIFVRIKFGISHQENDQMDTIPHLCAAPFCLMCGLFTDLIVKRNYLTITTIRKVLTTIGCMGPSIFIFAATLLECSREATLVMLCVGMVLKSAFFASTELNPLDLAPNFAGTLKGIINALTMIVNLIGPAIENNISNLPYERGVSEWQMIFIIALMIMALTNFAYVTIGNSEEQDWNKLRSKREEPSADLNNRISRNYEYN